MIWDRHLSAGRSTALDLARALGILLVVCGHTLEIALGAPNAPFNETAFVAFQWGAAFLMQTFFFMSGLVFRADRDLPTVIRQSLVLVLLSLVVSIGADLIRVVVFYVDTHRLLPITPIDAWTFVKTAGRMVLIGNEYSVITTWYFVALAVVRVLAAVVVRVHLSTGVAMVASLICMGLLVRSMDWRNFYQIYSVGFGLLFFLLGRASPALFEALDARRSLALLTALLSGVLYFSIFDFNRGCTLDVLARCGPELFPGHFLVFMVEGVYGNLLVFVVTSLVGILFALSSCMAITHLAEPAARFIAPLGRASLYLLIVNGLMLDPALNAFFSPRMAGGGAEVMLAIVIPAIVGNLMVLVAFYRPLTRLHAKLQALVDGATGHVPVRVERRAVAR